MLPAERRELEAPYPAETAGKPAENWRGHSERHKPRRIAWLTQSRDLRQRGSVQPGNGQRRPLRESLSDPMKDLFLGACTAKIKYRSFLSRTGRLYFPNACSSRTAWENLR